VQSQESLERIFDEKIHALDVKLTEVQTTVNKLEADIEITKQEKEAILRDDDGQDDLVQDSSRQTAQVPRGSRSAAIPVPDTRTIASAPPTVPAVATTPPPVSMIRLHHIYNFLLFHANILQFPYTFGNFLYYFLD
jgi:hypothetical protein